MQVGTISMDIYSTETNIFSVFGLNSVNFLSIPLLSIFQNSLNKKLNSHPPPCSWYNIYPWSFYQTVGPRSGQPLALHPSCIPVSQQTDVRPTVRWTSPGGSSYWRSPSRGREVRPVLHRNAPARVFSSPSVLSAAHFSPREQVSNMMAKTLFNLSLI